VCLLLCEVRCRVYCVILIVERCSDRAGEKTDGNNTQARCADAGRGPAENFHFSSYRSPPDRRGGRANLVSRARPPARPPARRPAVNIRITDHK